MLFRFPEEIGWDLWLLKKLNYLRGNSKQKNSDEKKKKSSNEVEVLGSRRWTQFWNSGFVPFAVDGERREDSESEEGEMEKGMTNHVSKKRGQVWKEDSDFTDVSVLYRSGSVDLTQMDNQVFIQKNGFSWEKPRIAIWNMHSNGEPHTSPPKKIKGEGSFFMDLGGAIVNK